eukprot:11830549-Alexandrium_andersonii.AAC.1
MEVFTPQVIEKMQGLHLPVHFLWSVAMFLAKLGLLAPKDWALGLHARACAHRYAHVGVREPAGEGNRVAESNINRPTKRIQMHVATH